MKNESSYILAIEAAVGGGSIALVRDDGPTIVYEEGNAASRAERILSVIANVISDAGITPQALMRIAVSTGPGSYSGIRIGMATALGLSNAIGVQASGMPVLAAMAQSCVAEGSLIVAIPIGKNDVAWQEFGPVADDRRVASNEPELLSLPSFLRAMDERGETTIFAHSDVISRIDGFVRDSVTVIDSGRGLAAFIGLAARVVDGVRNSSLQPIYLRNKDAVSRPGAF